MILVDHGIQLMLRYTRDYKYEQCMDLNHRCDGRRLQAAWCSTDNTLNPGGVGIELEASRLLAQCPDHLDNTTQLWQIPVVLQVSVQIYVRIEREETVFIT